MTNETDPVLETRGLVKRFNGVTAVDNINFRLNEGGIHTIIGPNGAGKTTFLNLINGKVRITSGVILFNGRDITRLSANERARLGIASTSQLPDYFPNLTVYENIRLAAQSFSPMRWHPLTHYSKLKDVNRRTEEVIESFALESHASLLALELSHGLAKRLELGMALAMDAKLILMDEPTQGLAAKETVEVVNLIKNLGKQRTILVVEHNLDVVFQISDVLSFFHNGRMLAEGTPMEIAHNVDVKTLYMDGLEYAEN